MASWRHRAPLVFEVRDLWPEVPVRLGILKNRIAIRIARWLERFVYRRAAHVIALSPDMEAGVKAVRPETPTTVIPNFCNLDAFSRPPPGGNLLASVAPGAAGPVILYAGTLGYVNRVTYLVEIARCARDIGSALAFVVVGDGAEWQAVYELAGRHGLLGRSFFVAGAIPKDQMPELLASATVAVSLVRDEPALWANSANKVFDALAAGRPIAINHGGWLAEVLRESGAGIVLPPADPLAAARCLAEFAGDAPRAQAAGRAARRLAEERFGAERLVQRFEQVLTGATGHAARR